MYLFYSLFNLFIYLIIYALRLHPSCLQVMERSIEKIHVCSLGLTSPWLPKQASLALVYWVENPSSTQASEETVHCKFV